MKTIQAIKIDSENESISLIEIPKYNNLHIIQSLIKCKTITGFQLDEYHFCYVNDEGLFCKPGYFFCIEGFNILPGDALIVGTNHKNGRDVSVKDDYLIQLLEDTIFMSLHRKTGNKIEKMEMGEF